MTFILGHQWQYLPVMAYLEERMKDMTKRDQRSISAAFADFARLWRNQHVIARGRMRIFPWLLMERIFHERI